MAFLKEQKTCVCTKKTNKQQQQQKPTSIRSIHLSEIGAKVFQAMFVGIDGWESDRTLADGDHGWSEAVGNPSEHSQKHLGFVIHSVELIFGHWAPNKIFQLPIIIIIISF